MTSLDKLWERRSFPASLLLPLSALFGLVVLLRRLLYRYGLLRSFRLPVPVIVVGNISVGGTGKTPLVLWLSAQLREQGYRPGIISRGYGAASVRRPQEVLAQSDPLLVGDEPVLLAQRSQCPVWVGRERAAVGRALLGAHPECDVIISDDGLQHYALQRDVEIAVVDGTRKFGNGWLLPAGPLRETRSRLREVDAVVVNGASSDDISSDGVDIQHKFSMQLHGDTFRNLLDASRSAPAQHFIGRRVSAVAGIGNPQRFFDQLRRMGLRPVTRAFPDHHVYRPEDLQIADTEAILMTEKDAVKCTAFSQPHWWYLQVTAEVNAALLNRILEKLRGRDGRQAA